MMATYSFLSLAFKVIRHLFKYFHYLHWILKLYCNYQHKEKTSVEHASGGGFWVDSLLTFPSVGNFRCLGPQAGTAQEGH